MKFDEFDRGYFWGGIGFSLGNLSYSLLDQDIVLGVVSGTWLLLAGILLMIHEKTT